MFWMVEHKRPAGWTATPLNSLNETNFNLSSKCTDDPYKLEICSWKFQVAFW